MSDPVVFDSTSARFGLPLLFVGQAQKEAYVNEALGRLDGLLFCAIEGETATPPTSPADGQAWLVATGPTGAWTGHAGELALRQAGQWLFVSATDGMRLLNRATGQDMRRAGGLWRTATAPMTPTGGTVIDAEARSTIVALVAALRQAGVFPL
jgi:hypothetical protein